MPSKYPETTQKIFTTNGISSEKNSNDSSEIVQRKGRRKGGQKRWVEGLAKSQKKIIELVKINPKISKKEMSNRIGINTTSIDKNIEKLKQNGLLKRVGFPKGGHWEILV